MIDYFNGDAKYGVYLERMILNIKKDHHILLSMVSCKGSNTKVEFMASWGLLQFTKIRGVFRIKILSDPKVSIDWENI